MGCGASTEVPATVATPAPTEKPAPAPVAKAPVPAPVASAPAAAKTSSPKAEAATKPTYKFETLSSDNYLKLPKLPLPKLDATLEKLLASCKACAESPAEVAALEEKIASLKSGPGKDLQAAIEESEKHEGYPYSWIQKYWDEMYNGIREPNPINVSPFFSIDDKDKSTLKCAKFALAFCKWSKKVASGDLDADPMCMHAAGKLFNSAKIPKKGMDVFYQDISGQNIVIVSGGTVFSIDAFSGGKLLSAEALAKAIEAAKAAPAKTTEDSLPILTAANRDVWASERDTLLSDSANKASLEMIDRAIIVIAVDKMTENEKSAQCKNFLTGNTASRWWDKNQIVLDATDSMGINFEHSYSDGTNWGRFIAECMNDVTGAPTKPYTPLPTFDVCDGVAKELTFTLPASTKAAIASTLADYMKAVADVDMKFLGYKGWGKSSTKGWGLSPDAAVQLAYQIAFYRLYGKAGVTYEAAQTRKFFVGRTETIRSCTIESAAMAKAFKDGPGDTALLLEAAKKQAANTKAASLGNGIDRHLYVLEKVADAKGLDVALFKDPLFLRSKGWLMSTSNGTAPYLNGFGFAPTHPNGHGMGYLIGAKGIDVCCSAYSSGTKGAVAFADALSGALDDMKAAFEEALKPKEVSKALAVVINCGSSSLKYGVFDLVSEGQAVLLASGLVEKIGLDVGLVKHEKEGYDAVKVEMPIPDHMVGLSKVVELLMSSNEKEGVISRKEDVKVVGHRVVHGGDTFTASALIDAAAKQAIQNAAALAPLHNPANIMGIEVCEKLFPVPQVACFDTSFHMTMGPEAYLYAIPIELYKEKKIRRYGFHGTSYTFVTQATAEALHSTVEDLNLIVCHLGNGSSMACISGGKCLDTTMGMTPLEGLCMGTRSGDVDAGVYTHLTKGGGGKEMTPKDVDTMLNKKSGLAGLCGNSDMREVIDRASKGDEDSKNALGVFVHRIRKYLGAFLVKLGGKCDAIVFAGGIGENAKLVRELILKDLSPLGIELDEAKNNSMRGLSQLQTTFSKTKIMIVPTNEELSIALQASKITGCAPKKVVETPTSAASGGESMSIKEHASEDIFSVDQKVTNAVYIESISGSKSTVEVGLMYQVLTKAAKIGYFRPFADAAHGTEDSHTTLMKELFELPDSLDTMYGVTVDEAMKMLTEGKEDELLDAVIGKYEAFKKGKDFVLVSGTVLPAESHDWNTKMAATLNVPMILCSNLKKNQTPDSIFRDLTLSKQELDADGNNVELAGVLVNKLDVATLSEVNKELDEKFSSVGIKYLGGLPKDARLAALALSDIKTALSAEVLYGSDQLHNKEVMNVIVAAASMTEVLHQWKEKPNSLIMLHSSRSDIFLALILTMQASTYPPIAGLVICGTETLEPAVVEALAGLDTIPVPVIWTKHTIYDAVSYIGSLSPVISAKSAQKVEASNLLFSENADKEALNNVVGEDHELVMTPKLFQYKIFTAARSMKQHIVLPEGEDKRVVMAAAELVRRDLCEVTLLGKVDEVTALAAKHQADLTGVHVIYPPEAPDFEELVGMLVEARKAKGMTEQKARDMIAGDFNWYGTMRMYKGDIDGMVSGACHTTADTMRPALMVIKTAPGFSLVSSVFFMLLPEKVYIYGDCAINVDPNPKQLAEIAVASANTGRAFGINPKVALLSYATGESNSGAIIDKIREATAHAREIDAAAGSKTPFEGPIQFDAAVDAEVAKVKFKKDPTNAVAGKATICVFPDLNAGNNAYKAVQQASGCIAMGPIMQGMKKPVNDLSRGCTVDDIVNTTVITCIQAIGGKKK